MEVQIPRPLQHMNSFYKLFTTSIDRKELLTIFKIQESEGMLVDEKGIYQCVDTHLMLKQAMAFPLFEQLGMERNTSDVMLCSIDKETGLHCNPGNNGLAILPLEGSLDFDFYDYLPPNDKWGRTSFLPKDTTDEVLETHCQSLRGIDGPIVFNGRWIHNYYPSNGKAIFYAVKIPFRLDWKQTTDILR
jgi:hypothetical protein